MSGRDPFDAYAAGRRDAMTTPKDKAFEAVIEYLRNASSAIYLATEQIVADDISPRLIEAAEILAAQADRIEGLGREIAMWRDTAERLQAATAAQAKEREELAKRIAELERLVYVPGMRKCAKCACTLVTTNLHVQDGAFSANNEPQQCPNGCGPMWPVTERQAGNDLIDRWDTMRVRAEAAEFALAAERKRLEEADAALLHACDAGFLPDGQPDDAAIDRACSRALARHIARAKKEAGS